MPGGTSASRRPVHWPRPTAVPKPLQSDTPPPQSSGIFLKEMLPPASLGCAREPRSRFKLKG